MSVNIEDFVTPSNHFKWKEVLYLPSWGIYHTPSDEEISNLTELITRIDVLRDYYGKSFNVHCCIRPTSVNCPGSQYHGQDYNAHVGGAKHSTHIIGCAIDFDVSGMTVDQVMQDAANHLDDWQLSWEKNGSAVHRNWCHAQTVLVDGVYKIFIP